MPTAFEGFKSGNTIIPCKDVAAFPRSEQAVLGAGNFMPETVYALGMSSTLGTVTLSTNNDAVTFVAKIERNKHYYLSKVAGNRFRVALSTTAPANGTSATLIYTNDAGTSYEFDSGSNDYVILLTNIGSIDESTIHPLLALFKDTPYAPYAMTNKELTENKLDKESVILASTDDLDNIFENGLYSWQNSPVHAPTSSWGKMIVQADANTTPTQFVYQIDKIFIRRYGGSPASWSSWYAFTGTVVS